MLCDLVGDRICRRGSCHLLDGSVSGLPVVLVFDRWGVVDGFEEPAGVPPLHPRRVAGSTSGMVLQGSFGGDQFGLARPTIDSAIVVVGVSFRADGGDGSLLRGVRCIGSTGIGCHGRVVDETSRSSSWRVETDCSRASRARSASRALDILHRGSLLDKTSRTNDVLANLDQVVT